jgi:alkylhydroperoxidase family enzyme
MARLDPVPPASRTLVTRACFWLVRRLFGRDLKPYAIAAHAPRVGPSFLIANACLETGSWALEPDLRKLVHLRVAQIIGCVF